MPMQPIGWPCKRRGRVRQPTVGPCKRRRRVSKRRGRVKQPTVGPCKRRRRVSKRRKRVKQPNTMLPRPNSGHGKRHKHAWQPNNRPSAHSLYSRKRASSLTDDHRPRPSVALIVTRSTSFQAVAGEKQTNWRRILVHLHAAAIRPLSLYGRVAATSMLDEKISQVFNDEGRETRKNQRPAQKQRSFSHSSRFWSLFPLAETLSLCLNRS
jgi:hypothetical protein